MSAVEQAKEPSMEEILASIRRIISEDDSGGKSAEEPKAKAPEPAEPEAVEAVGAAMEMAAEDEGEVPDLGQDSVDALFDEPVEDDLASEVDTDAPDIEAGTAEPEDVFELSQNDIVEDDTENTRVTQPDIDDVCFDEDNNTLETGDADFGAAAAEEPQPALAAEPDFEPASELMSQHESSSTLMSATTDAAVSAAFGNLANTILSNNARTLEDLVREMLSPMLKAWIDENLPTLVERLVREEIERVARGGGR